MFSEKVRNFIVKLQGLSDAQKKAILLAVVIIAGLPLGIFWVVSSGKIINRVGSNTKPVALPIINIPEFDAFKNLEDKTQFQVVVPSEDTEWKTYSNEEYGFKFRYPASWHRKDKTEMKYSFSAFCPDTDENCTTNAINLYIYTPGGNNDMLESWRQQGPGYKEENIVVGGFSAIKRQESYCNSTPRLTSGVFIETDNLNLQIQGPVSECGIDPKTMSESYNGAEGVLNQILSTFKFTK